MEIKLITGESTYQACVNTIKQIDVGDLEGYNLLVVPDTFSMQAESLLFEVLNLKSVFNVEVVGISKLASRILRENNIAYQRVSGLEEVFNIYKAVKACEKDFLYFNKTDVDFCTKILQIIKQFKGCKIRPEKIKNIGDDVLDRKMHDIKIIYEKYEELLGEKLDLSKLLEFCAQNAENKLDLSKINLYFANFDSFSLEINTFICKLATMVGKVCIGIARPLSQNNAFIFEDDILKKITSLAKEHSLVVKTENFSPQLGERNLRIVKNLFGFEVESGKDIDFFTNVLAKNKQEEVEFVAKYIKNAIFSGFCFKNFSVAVPDESYFDKLKVAFEKYKITYYSDDAVDLSDTILCRFLLKIVQLSKLGLNKERLQYLANCPLIEVSDRERVLEEIFYYNIEEKTEFLERFPEFSPIITQIDNLSKGETLRDFALVLREIVQLCEGSYQKIVDDLQKQNYFKEESQNSQAKALLLQVFDKLELLGGEEKLNLLDFENLLTLALQSVKVETIPSYINAVYVGNATTSYFEDVDTLFVLGATANSLPQTRSDTGIIDDNDIAKLSLNFLIEPEIKVLNRRSRLKLFECLLHAKEKLIVSCPAVEDGKQSQVSNFVKDLRKLFGENILHTEALEDINLADASREQSFDYLKFFIGGRKNLASAYSLLKAKGKLPFEFEGAVKSELDKEIFEPKKVEALSKETRGVLIKNHSVSASQLETYFRCPFKHFISYGLRLKQNENIEPNKRLFGVFEHAVLQKFVETYKNLSKLQKSEVEKFLNENVEQIAGQVYDAKILKRKHFIAFLKNETRIVLQNLIYEQSVSSFSPTLLEEKISNGLLEDVKLVGFVDRADVYNKFFRVIDYKTGKTQTIKKDLFYGKKLQLFLYAKALQEKLNLPCAGVYYFDCQTKYSKGGSETRFNGLTLADEKVALATDKRLIDDAFKSDIVGFSCKKTAKEGDFPFKGGNPVESFETLFSYADKIAKSAVDEIRQGFILDKPLKNECKNCPYLAICRHRAEEGWRVTQRVSDEAFKRETDDN